MMKKGRRVCPVLSAKLLSKSKEEVPVIIRVRDNDSNKLSNLVFNMSGRVKYNLPLVGGVACNMSIGAIDKLSRDPGIEYISFDSKVFALLDVATKSIGCEIPHMEGYKGQGVTVAVIDTGVSSHNDLTKPTNRIVGFKDFINNRSNPYDDNGHGTHVAGIIASNGYSSNGKYAGVAPEANILAVKALDENGSGSTSDIVSAIQWVIETKSEYNTKILNLSLGTPATDPISSDPLVKACEQAIRAGLTVVVAAGNSGPAKQTILSPGNSPSVITVGAVDGNGTPEIDDNVIAPFSSRGPTKEGYKKPDVVAPGVDIKSLSNKQSSGYSTLSGTSMATPFVSGAAALLYNKNKGLSSSTIKSKLMDNCISLNDNYNSQGSGIISLKDMFNAPIKEASPRDNPSSTNIFGEGFIIILLVILLLIR